MNHLLKMHAGAPPNAACPVRNSQAFMLATLFLVAMIVRVAMVYAHEPVLFSDSTGFMGPTFVPLSCRELAVAILNWDMSADLGVRAPGYPAFMAACFSLFGLDNFHAIVVAQSLLGAILFFAAYWLWFQIYGPGVAAVVATATAVLEPVLILQNSAVAIDLGGLSRGPWLRTCLAFAFCLQLGGTVLIRAQLRRNSYFSRTAHSLLQATMILAGSMSAVENGKKIS